jgi:hypothetical protein
MSFDGSNDYVLIDPWSWGGTTSFETYVKIDVLPSYTFVFDFTDGNYDYLVFIAHSERGRVMTMPSGSASVLTSLSTSWFVAGTWVHAVGTVEGTTMKLYKNGVLTDSMSNGASPGVATRTHYLGTGNPGYFTGEIAYLRMWHGTALSASDVAALYGKRDSISTPVTFPPTQQPSLQPTQTQEPTLVVRTVLKFTCCCTVFHLLDINSLIPS